jgi:hypothetical protein
MRCHWQFFFLKNFVRQLVDYIFCTVTWNDYTVGSGWKWVIRHYFLLFTSISNLLPAGGNQYPCSSSSYFLFLLPHCSVIPDWLSICLSGKLLLALASTVILGSESRWTHDHILLSHDSGSRATLTHSHISLGKVHSLSCPHENAGAIIFPTTSDCCALLGNGHPILSQYV